MKITKRFKDGLTKAKQQGYKRVYSVIGAYKSTKYCYFVNIDELLSLPIGASYGPPKRQSSYWTGWPNTRHATKEDIQYNQVFKL